MPYLLDSRGKESNGLWLVPGYDSGNGEGNPMPVFMPDDYDLIQEWKAWERASDEDAIY